MILLRASKDYPFIYPKIRLSKKDVKIRSCRSSKHFWKKGGDLNKTSSSTRPSCWPRILESFVILLGENRRAIFDDNRCSLLARTREIRIKPGEEIDRERGEVRREQAIGPFGPETMLMNLACHYLNCSQYATSADPPSN